MQTADEIREEIKRLHVDLNRWTHNTPFGREMRSDIGKKIQALQMVYERMVE